MPDDELDGWIDELEENFVRAMKRTFRAFDRSLSIGRVLVGAAEPAAAAGGSGVSAADVALTAEDAISLTTAWTHEAAKLNDDLSTVFTAGAYGLAAEIGEAVLPAAAAEALIVPPVVNQMANEYMAQASNRVKGLSDLAWEDTRHQISEGMAAGESMDELAARVRHAAQMSENRARTVARTETIMASNAGAYAQAQSLPDVVKPMNKQWLATPDRRTRLSHTTANGQIVELKKPFIVGGWPLMYPGDSRAPAGEVVNCRCTTVYDVDEVACACPAPEALVAAAGDNTGTSVYRIAREATGLSRKQMADALGWPMSQLWKIEVGKAEPTPAQFNQMMMNKQFNIALHDVGVSSIADAQAYDLSAQSQAMKMALAQGKTLKEAKVKAKPGETQLGDCACKKVDAPGPPPGPAPITTAQPVNASTASLVPKKSGTTSSGDPKWDVYANGTKIGEIRRYEKKYYESVAGTKYAHGYTTKKYYRVHKVEGHYVGPEVTGADFVSRDKAMEHLAKHYDKLNAKGTLTPTPTPTPAPLKPPSPTVMVTDRDIDTSTWTVDTRESQGLGGAHQKQVLRAPDGSIWLFKPQERFRAEVDVATARLQRRFGLTAPDTYVTKYGGRDGSVQQMFGTRSTRKNAFAGGFDPTKLTYREAQELQQHHVFDWLIGNHDGHAGQFLKHDNELVGIDKGQAFKFFGKDRLDYTYNPNGNYIGDTVYNQLHKALANGADVKGFVFHTGAKRTKLSAFIDDIRRMDDDEFISIIRPYAEAAARNRTLALGTNFSNDVEGFLRFAVARKNSLDRDYRAFHEGILRERRKLPPKAADIIQPDNGEFQLLGMTKGVHQYAPSTAHGGQVRMAADDFHSSKPWSISSPNVTNKQSFKRYTGTYSYEINASLRPRANAYGRGSAAADHARKMRAAMQRVDADVILTRGTGADWLPPSLQVNPRAAVGRVVKSEGFVSTSVDPSGAFGSSHRLRIRTRAGGSTRGVYLQPISVHKHEMELLLDHDTYFYVHAVRENNNGRGFEFDIEIVTEDWARRNGLLVES